MSISTRHSIWWPRSESRESEPTSTLVVTSPSGLYVDVRPLKGTEQQPAFDWYFAGFEIPHSESTIEFNHDFLDSHYISHYHSGNPGKFKIETDIGQFADSEDHAERSAGIRIETGEMENPATGKIEPYVEKWITCDPHREELSFKGESSSGEPAKCIVADTIQGGTTDNENANDVRIGRIIILGGWIQGILWHKCEGSEQANVGIYRAFNGKSIISYGGEVQNLIDAAVKVANEDDKQFLVNGITWETKERVEV